MWQDFLACQITPQGPHYPAKAQTLTAPTVVGAALLPSALTATTQPPATTATHTVVNQYITNTNYTCTFKENAYAHSQAERLVARTLK